MHLDSKEFTSILLDAGRHFDLDIKLHATSIQQYISEPVIGCFYENRVFYQFAPTYIQYEKMSPTHVLSGVNMDITRESVLQELYLCASQTKCGLGQLRKTYARNHHPDMMRDAEKSAATYRMQIANDIIDVAFSLFL